MEDANETILNAFENYDSLKKHTEDYADELMSTKSNLAQKIIDICGNES